MTEMSSPTARSAEAAPTDESPVRAAAREHLAAAVAVLRTSDEAALHTLANRLAAELYDHAYQSGHDRVPG